ncbi:MAG: cadmium-translocating P-type ATPase [Clostridia bacterium]|nr:cadmium-translocating P-type ATPase [Clostridia bacterium]
MMEKIRYTLENLDCAGCAAKAEAAVNKAPWIEKATVDFMNKRLTVHLSDINPNADEDIQRIVDSVLVGVNVVLYEGEDSAGMSRQGKGKHGQSGSCSCYDEEDCELRHGHSHEHDEAEHSSWMMVTTVLALVAGAVGMAAHFIAFPAHEIVSAAGYIAAIVLAGYDVAMKGVKSVCKLRLDESALMAIAMVAAAILGEFFEGAMVAVLYRIGEWLEDKAVDNSRESIEALAEIRPDTANVRRSTGVAVVRAEEVAIGETILIRPHERIPLDCMVTEGTSDIDSSALTGESLPIAAEPGSELLSGMMNGDGSLTARVTNNYENSAAARIISLVTESTENKGNAEKFVTRFAVVYTPIVVGLAFVIALLPPLLGFGSFRDFIFRSLTFLVASCPCAIVISVPLAFFSSIGGASKMGVLVKGGNFAEQLARARAIAFDKTGTVTEGKPKVQEVIPAEGFTAEEAAQLAAAAEINSTHPYAQAIREFAGTVQNITEYKNYTELAGHGVSCENAEGKCILCGGGKLMKKYGIPLPDEAAAQAYVSYDGRLAGSIYISDSPKEGAENTVAALKALGADRLTMLTGDSFHSAKQVAESVGIENFRAELLPENKVEAIEEMKSQGYITAFVGDGINDAPVLAAADVGIAMGLGSGAAIEAADMVLSSNNLAALPGAIRHFRRTMGIIRFNIAFALLFKAAVLIAAAFGYAPMWAAVFADVGVCLICVANASRLIEPKK